MLAICAVCKDEREDYIREWIDWHLKLGIDFIYIFDNDSEVPLKNLLSDIPNVGIAPCKGKAMQMHAYNFFIERYRGVIEWAAFIDLDDFIIVRKDVANIKRQLGYYPDFSGIGLQWKIFGSNGLIDNHESQIKAFTKRIHDDSSFE